MSDTPAATAARRVEQLSELGRFDAAEQQARRALAAEPNDPDLLVALAATLLRAKKHVEGLAAIDAAVAVAPQAERVHRLRALLLARMGRHPEAVESGDRAVQLAPNEPLAATGYAAVLQVAGRLREAADVAHRVVALSPESASAHFLLADISSDLRDNTTARRAYLETLRLDPAHAVARHDLAVLDSRAHRPARALRGFVDAGVLDPTMPQVLANVSAMLWSLSWRLRFFLALATMAVVLSSPVEPSWSTRTTATVVLLVGAGIAWWTLRGLPSQTRPAVRAALRRDVPLRITALALVLCVPVFVLVAVTGVGGFGVLVWLVLAGLAVLAVGTGLWRRIRRR